MVNTHSLTPLSSTVRLYVVLAAATVVALVVMSAVDPRLATDHAWGHAIIVGVFAVLLPLRLRAARAGQRSGLRAVGIISGVLLVANVVEGLLPSTFPTWMRVEMFAIAALMAINVSFVVRAALQR